MLRLKNKNYTPTAFYESQLRENVQMNILIELY